MEFSVLLRHDPTRFLISIVYKYRPRPIDYRCVLTNYFSWYQSKTWSKLRSASSEDHVDHISEFFCFFCVQCPAVFLASVCYRRPPSTRSSMLSSIVTITSCESRLSRIFVANNCWALLMDHRWCRQPLSQFQLKLALVRCRIQHAQHGTSVINLFSAACYLRWQKCLTLEIA